MLDFIERRGLAGFIDGTVEAPPKRIPVSDVGHDYAISTEEVENDDYSSWERSEVYLGPVQLSSKKSMLDFTDLQGLAGFIDGTVEALPEGVPVSDIGDYSASSIEEVDNQDYRSWKRSDNLIWGWILIMLTKYILQQVLHFRTAKVVWTMLEKMFHVAKAFSQLDKETETRLKCYQSLHKDAIKGDWENALKFIKQEPDAIRVPITVWSETALRAAVRWVRRNRFAKKLVENMAPEDLALADFFGQTALHIAAGANNIEAAKLLVQKNLKLSNVQDFDGYIPLHYAAAHGNREMVLYLSDVIREDAKLKPLINQVLNCYIF